MRERLGEGFPQLGGVRYLILRTGTGGGGGEERGSGETLIVSSPFSPRASVPLGSASSR